MAGTPAPDNATVLRMIQACKAAGAAGRTGEADQLLARVAQLAPAHPAVLNELGLRMMQRGDSARARELLQRAPKADPGHPSLWSNLAQSLHELNLPTDEFDAIERALALEPRHLASLLQKGQLLEHTGDPRNAARAYRNAIATLPAGTAAPEGVAAMIEHARAAIAKDDAALAAAIEERLAAIREQHGGGSYRRIEHCIELLTGGRTRFTPQPTFMYFPEIPAVEFFERNDFPWLDAIEAATDEIRAELMTVLVSDGARAARILLDTRARHAHPPAHRRHQHAPDGAPAAHRAPAVRLSRRQRDARMGRGRGLGVRRHHRARGLEPRGRAARGADLRRLESVPHARRT